MKVKLAFWKGKESKSINQRISLYYNVNILIVTLVFVTKLSSETLKVNMKHDFLTSKTFCSKINIF